jgi:hypothetical protein
MPNKWSDCVPQLLTQGNVVQKFLLLKAEVMLTSAGSLTAARIAADSAAPDLYSGATGPEHWQPCNTGARIAGNQPLLKWTAVHPRHHMLHPHLQHLSLQQPLQPSCNVVRHLAVSTNAPRFVCRSMLPPQHCPCRKAAATSQKILRVVPQCCPNYTRSRVDSRAPLWPPLRPSCHT